MGRKRENRDKRPAAVEPSEDNLVAFVSALAKESDRGCLLISHSLVADMLEILLRSVFARLLKGEAQAVECGEWLMRAKPVPPLGGFIKLEVATALGVIKPGTRESLRRLNNLRNAHGHGISPFSFDLKEVRHIREPLTEREQKRIAKLAKDMQLFDRMHAPPERVEFIVTTSWQWTALKAVARGWRRKV